MCETKKHFVDKNGELTDSKKVSHEDMENYKNKKFAIRKLTPEECAILMGLTASDIQKCRNVGVSDSQLYKQMGNGLGTPCVQFIMEHLKKMYKPDYITTDERYVAKYGISK